MSVTLRNVLDVKTGMAVRVLWDVKGYEKLRTVGTKVSDQWIDIREGAGKKQETWLNEVAAFVESQLAKGNIPKPDTEGDIWYDVNTFTLP